MNNFKNAVAYYRVSTDRQGKSGLGLEAQQSSVQDYAASKNLQLVHQFTEIESGRKNIRPVLQEALGFCKKNKTLLIIAKPDRLARNVAFISNMIESKVLFVAVDNPTINPQENPFVLHILAAVAELEQKQISKRTKEALQAAKRRGQLLGINGKVLAKNNQDQAQLFAQETAPVIHELRKLGFITIRALTLEMNKRQVPTFYPSKQWHRTTIHNLLKRLPDHP